MCIYSKAIKRLQRKVKALELDSHQQVQPNWDETNSENPSFILNKPTIPDDEKLKTTTISSGQTYYPIVGNNTQDSETKYIHPYGFHYSSTSNGLQATAEISLGNLTTSGLAGSTYGRLSLYGTGSHRAVITSGNPTADRDIVLPDASGTVALIWTGTLAQYDALSPNYNNNTIYIII